MNEPPREVRIRVRGPAAFARAVLASISRAVVLHEVLGPFRSNGGVSYYVTVIEQDEHR